MQRTTRFGMPFIFALGLLIGALVLVRSAQGSVRQPTVESDAGDAAIQPRERLFFATGEYDCKRDWDAIIRLDDTDSASAAELTVTETLSIPVKQLMTDTAGVPLNFVHNIYVHEGRDEMYVSALFTGVDPDVGRCDTENMHLKTGSVAVLDNVGQGPGAQTLVRHLYGDETGLLQPHGVWIDRSRELLYVANTHAGNILVFENAYSVDGNVAPSRIITSSLMRGPTHIYVDEATDRMFVANFSGEDLRLDANTNYPDDGTLPSILIFEGASSLDGAADPAIRIVDNDGVVPDPTRLREGVAHITHNVWYAAEHNLIFVVHHTNEVLVYDLDRVGAPPPDGCPNPQRCALRPKAIIEVGSDTATEYFSAYGIFYRPQEDRLYVTVGRTDASTQSDTGYEIVPGVPPNVILVYEGVSSYESNVPTAFTPARRIYWPTGADQYYPPQPIWVTVDYPLHLPFVER